MLETFVLIWYLDKGIERRVSEIWIRIGKKKLAIFSFLFPFGLLIFKKCKEATHFNFWINRNKAKKKKKEWHILLRADLLADPHFQELYIWVNRSCQLPFSTEMKQKVIYLKHKAFKLLAWIKQAVCCWTYVEKAQITKNSLN